MYYPPIGALATAGVYYVAIGNSRPLYCTMPAAAAQLRPHVTYPQLLPVHCMQHQCRACTSLLVRD
jgi:hypothetical protein